MMCSPNYNPLTNFGLTLPSSCVMVPLFIDNTPRELNRIRQVIEIHYDKIIEARYEHCGQS
jgi:hypothetical protein